MSGCDIPDEGNRRLRPPDVSFLQIDLSSVERVQRLDFWNFQETISWDEDFPKWFFWIFLSETSSKVGIPVDRMSRRWKSVLGHAELHTGRWESVGLGDRSDSWRPKSRGRVWITPSELPSRTPRQRLHFNICENFSFFHPNTKYYHTLRMSSKRRRTHHNLYCPNWSNTN